MAESKKQPPSYVDFMNDVFETSLPNACATTVDPRSSQRTSSSCSKTELMYKDKWMEAKNHLNDAVIVRLNGVDFGINWKIFGKLEPVLESGDCVVWGHSENGTKIYYANRNVPSFEAILDYYRSGELHMPVDVCPNIFKRELTFWRVDFRLMSQCCLRKYANFHENEQTLSEFDDAYRIIPDPNPSATKRCSMSRWRRTQVYGWAILSDPSSSLWAKVYLGVASFFVILSVFLLAASTNNFFLRALNQHEWEEYMTSSELDYYYELIYNRPKDNGFNSGQGGGSAGDGSFERGSASEEGGTPTGPPGIPGPGPPGSARDKRSVPDSIPETNRHPLLRHRRNALRSDRNAQVNEPLDLDGLSRSFDVGGENEFAFANNNDDDDDASFIQMNLAGLVNHVLSAVKKSSIAKRTRSSQKGETSKAEYIRKRKRNGVEENDDDIIEVVDDEPSYNYPQRRKKNRERDSPDHSEEPRGHRYKRAAVNNDTGFNSTNNTLGANYTGECIYLTFEDLKRAVAEITAKAVTQMSKDSVVSLPTAYTVYHWAAYLEIMCIVFFAVEFLVRFIFAPSKIHYLLSFFTIIDFLALVTMLTTQLIDTLNPKEKYTTSVVDAINCFQVARVFRFFRLMKDVVGFQVLVFSIKSSWRELLLLVLYIVMAVTIFSTLIYYSEKENMKSIPDASWWAIVTMTTVGYGDMAPETLWGKMIGVGCALSGVLLIAVTVPVFVNNFLLFYEHSKVSQYESKKTSDENSRKLLQSETASEMSDTTSAGDSVDKESYGKEPVTREGSRVELTNSKPRLRSEVSISKVTPILINSREGTTFNATS